MTPQTARCYIAALSIAAKIEGMKAENAYRQNRGEVIAYAEEAFFYEANELARLAIEVINQ
jgi:hypothetical protein